MAKLVRTRWRREPKDAGGGTAGRSALFGAMFLMATSAIGPGFITQTTAFTVQLGVAFAFAIAVSIIIDIAPVSYTHLTLPTIYSV